MKNKHFNKLFLALLGSSLFTSAYTADVFANENLDAEVVTAEVKNNEVAANVSTEEKFVLSVEDYKRKDASDLAMLVREKKITSEELVKIAFEVIKEENKDLNAVLATREEEALKEAKALDALPEIEKNKPFFGVPTLMKGFGHDVAGLPNTYGYKYNSESIAKRDSRITKEFKDLGFVVLGNTNYPEGAMRNITDSILYGPAKNPLNKEHNAGGSSGGSAAAVASGMVPLASGSDIGGSIRIPAGWTGLLGLKPTSYGGYAVHFPLVKSVRDAELFFENTADKKHKPVKVDDIKKLKIGYTTTVSKNMEVSDEAKEAVAEAVKFLKEQGFTVEEITYPLGGDHMLAEYTHVATSGNKNLDKLLKSKNLTKYDVDPLTWALHVYSKDLDTKEANKLRTNSVKELEKQAKKIAEFHKQYPIILTPTNAQLAPLNSDYYVTPEMREILYNFDQVPKEKRYETLVKQWEPMFKRTPYTLISNLTKEPSISLPTYMGPKKLPLGIMLNGGVGYDNILLKFAKLFEDNNKFKINNTITNKYFQNGKAVQEEDLPEAKLQEVDLPFKRITMQDETLSKGIEKKIVSGKKGKKLIVEVDGKISEEVIIKPVNEVMLLGTKEVSNGKSVNTKDERPEAKLREIEIPSRTIFVKDDKLPKETVTELVSGKNGKKLIVEVDGLISEEVIEQSENKVVLVGTKEEAVTKLLDNKSESDENIVTVINSNNAQITPKKENKENKLPNTGEKSTTTNIILAGLLLATAILTRKIKI